MAMVTQLENLLQKVYMGGRIPSAWRGTRLVVVAKTKKAGWGGDQSKRRSVGLETSAAKNCSLYREKKDGNADGEAMQKLADGRHSTEISGDRVARREGPCGRAA